MLTFVGRLFFFFLFTAYCTSSWEIQPYKNIVSKITILKNGFIATTKSDFCHYDTHHNKFSDTEVYHCWYHGKIWILIFQTSIWIIPTKPCLKCPYLKCPCGTMIALLTFEPLSEQLTTVKKRWFQCTLQYIHYDCRILFKEWTVISDLWPWPWWKCEILVAVLMKMQVICNMIPCKMVNC